MGGSSAGSPWWLSKLYSTVYVWALAKVATTTNASVANKSFLIWISPQHDSRRTTATDTTTGNLESRFQCRLAGKGFAAARNMLILAMQTGSCQRHTRWGNPQEGKSGRSGRTVTGGLTFAAKCEKAKQPRFCGNPQIAADPHRRFISCRYPQCVCGADALVRIRPTRAWVATPRAKTIHKDELRAFKNLAVETESRT